jgi:hypothetical protein
MAGVAQLAQQQHQQQRQQQHNCQQATRSVRQGQLRGRDRQGTQHHVIGMMNLHAQQGQDATGLPDAFSAKHT